MWAGIIQLDQYIFFHLNAWQQNKLNSVLDVHEVD